MTYAERTLKRVELKCEYKALMEKYIAEFIEMSFENDKSIMFNKISDNIIEVCDYILDIDDIRYIVDYDVDFEEWEEWYEYCLRLGMVDLSIKPPTLDEWLNGQNKLNDNDLKRLEELKQNVDDAKNALHDEIDKLKLF